MAKNIWIVNEHLTSPDLSKNGHSRHFTLGIEFIKNGYDVSLITSSYSHNPKRKVKLNGLTRIINGKIRTLVLKGFEHQKSGSFIRIGNWILFSILFLFAPLTRLPKPNIIILSSTPMLPVYDILIFKLFYPKCKFIFETRDLWPLTPKSIGHYSDKSVFIKVLSHLERKCYTHADYIVSVLKYSNKHIKNILGHNKFNFKWISNGIDLKSFANNQKNKDWPWLKSIVKEDAFVIGYAGTLGRANAMEYIIDCFNSYYKNSKYYLVIIGHGSEKTNLVNSASNNENIIFQDSVKRDYLLSFYQNCDLLYLSWRNVALYRYGVSANKLFEYMYSKTPILMSSNIPENMIEEANCGLIAEPEDAHSIKENIEYYKGLSEAEKLKLGQNGFNFVTANLSYEKLSNDYIAVFDELTTSVNN